MNVARGFRIGLVVGFVAWVSLFSCRDRGAFPNDLPDVLLLTVDTLRADHLGCYGYSRETSPNLDRLAAEGILFANAITPWPKTPPATAALMSSAYGHTNWLLWKRIPDSEEVLPFLPEILGSHGYKTFAAVSNVHLAASYGFDRGFDTFVETWKEELEAALAKGKEKPSAPGWVKRYTSADKVNQAALDWMTRNLQAPQPLFLWLHYMEPHGPYVPPSKYDGLFRPTRSEPIASELIPLYQRLTRNGEPIVDREEYVSRYDREIFGFDFQLGRFLEKLGRLDRDRERLFVLTADHGESLGEHDYFFEHGRNPYEPSSRVPLIFHGSRLRLSGRVVKTPASLLDLAPTLLDLLEIPAPEGYEMQGVSLAPDLEGGDSTPRIQFIEAGLTYNPQVAVVDRPWKLIYVPSQRSRDDLTGEVFELYNLDSNPGETENLFGTHPDVAARMSRVLFDWYNGFHTRYVLRNRGAVSIRARLGTDGVFVGAETEGTAELDAKSNNEILVHLMGGQVFFDTEPRNATLWLEFESTSNEQPFYVGFEPIEPMPKRLEFLNRGSELDLRMFGLPEDGPLTKPGMYLFKDRRVARELNLSPNPEISDEMTRMLQALGYLR